MNQTLNSHHLESKSQEMIIPIKPDIQEIILTPKERAKHDYLNRNCDTPYKSKKCMIVPKIPEKKVEEEIDPFTDSENVREAEELKAELEAKKAITEETATKEVEVLAKAQVEETTAEIPAEAVEPAPTHKYRRKKKWSLYDDIRLEHREKSKDKRKHDAFIRYLPEEKQKVYLNNNKILISHLDLLFLFASSTLAERKGWFEDALFYGLTPSVLYSMIKELVAVDLLSVFEHNYRFKGKVSKRGFDFTNARGEKRIYCVNYEHPLYKKMEKKVLQMFVRNQAEEMMYKDFAKENHQPKLVLPRGTAKFYKTDTPEEAERNEIRRERIKLYTTGIYASSHRHFPKLRIPKDMVEEEFKYRRGEILIAKNQVFSAATHIQQLALQNYGKDYIEDLNYLNKFGYENPQFYRRYQPKCEARATKTSVMFKLSSRVYTKFCGDKFYRNIIAKEFGLKQKTDIHAEIFQMCMFFAGRKEHKLRRRDIYSKIVKDLGWLDDYQFVSWVNRAIKKPDLTFEEKVRFCVKQAVTRIVQLANNRGRAYNSCVGTVFKRVPDYMLNDYGQRISACLPKDRKYFDQVYALVSSMLDLESILTCDIYYWTSYIETRVVAELRRRNIFVENVYDEFYYNRKEIKAKELMNLVEDKMKEAATLYKKDLKDALAETATFRRGIRTLIN